MICKKCGESQGQAAPQCVEISSSGVRFVEHAWSGESGEPLTSNRITRGGAMRALTEARPRGRPQAPQAPPTIPGGPDMQDFFRLSGVYPGVPQRSTQPQSMTEQYPPHAPALTAPHARVFDPNLPDYLQPNIPDDYLHEDMPPRPGEFVREDMPKPPAMRIERTGPMTHAEILRECAPLCRLAGPGLLMGSSTTPGKVRSGRNSPYTGK